MTPMLAHRKSRHAVERTGGRGVACESRTGRAGTRSSAPGAGGLPVSRAPGEPARGRAHRGQKLLEEAVGWGPADWTTRLTSARLGAQRTPGAEEVARA